jgi:formylglycine-generating enzyme required for sulfatase activity
LLFGCVATISFLTGPVEAAPKVSQRWAILIGVDDYAHLKDLHYCGADQQALHKQLIATGFNEDQIFLLHDKATDVKYRPTKLNIEKQLDVVLKLADTNDLIIVGFSGHGMNLGGKNFFCPTDATLRDQNSLISLDGVYDRLRDCAAAFKLVLVDACRDDPTLGSSKSSTATDGTKALARSLQEVKLPEGVVLMNSCAPGEISWEEDQFGHGVFMHYVLEALSGGGDLNGDGSVSLEELQKYVTPKTKTYVARKFSDSQRPFIKGEMAAEAMEFALLPVRSVPGVVRPVMPQPGVTPANVKPGTPEAVVTVDALDLKLTYIPAGEFQMGSNESDDEKPVHTVKITKPFYLGVYEVTQGQWTKVMGDEPWSGKDYVQAGRDYPATYVSHDDVMDFCRKLTAQERQANRLNPNEVYRLPTEAEWEYACRAGTSTKYSFGDSETRIGDYAWYGGSVSVGDGNAKTEQYAHRVGTKLPNGWGLYDVHGNVYEWCQDWYDAKYYARSPASDPVNLQADEYRVLRGGCWRWYPVSCRSAVRSWNSPVASDFNLGFRLVRGPSSQ